MLAVVRELREHRAPASAEELADFLVAGASTALTAFALYTAPIVIGALARAVRGVVGGPSSWRWTLAS